MKQSKADATRRAHVEAIEKKFGVDLGVANDEELWEYLEKEGLPSLAKLLKITMKKRTTKKPEPFVDQTPAKQEPHLSTISNCTFTGVQWDASTLDIIKDVSKALLNLSELFRSQNVKIDSMLRIGGDGSINVADSTADINND